MIFWYGFAGGLLLQLISLVGFFSTPVRVGALVLLVAFALRAAIRWPHIFLFLWILELVAGHGGHTLEAFGVSVRLAFLVCAAVSVWSVRHKIPVAATWPCIAFIGAAMVGAFVGLYNGNDVRAVWADFVGYSFYASALVWTAYLHVRKFAWKATYAWIAGAFVSVALVTVVLFAVFSFHLIEIHTPIYSWWRDVMIGKATDTGWWFWRITSPAHLLAVPLLLIALRRCLEKITHVDAVLVISALTVLAINMSRAYLLAAMVGWVVLVFVARGRWVRAAYVSVAAGVSFLAIFFLLNAAVSGGKSFGVELLLRRGVGAVQQNVELSADIRRALLLPVKDMVRRHPFVGTGLGTPVTIVHPRTGAPFTTRSFDWGWLQVWTQIGFVGVTLFAWMVVQLLRSGMPVVAGCTAALSVTAIFGPTFFHPLGVVMVAFLWVMYYDPSL